MRPHMHSAFFRPLSLVAHHESSINGLAYQIRAAQCACRTATQHTTRRFASASAPPAGQPASSGIPFIFDRNVKKLQRDRAGRKKENRETDYLKDGVADMLVDRLLVRHLSTFGSVNDGTTDRVIFPPGIDYRTLNEGSTKSSILVLGLDMLSSFSKRAWSMKW